MRDAVGTWQEGRALDQKLGYSGEMRLLTDLVGKYYTLVLETTVESLAQWEQQGRDSMSQPEWKNWYAKFTPYVKKGYREIFNIVE